jgi:glycogen debranching enzyme
MIPNTMSTDAAWIDEPFSIITETEPRGLPHRVLKHGDTFGVFDKCGNIIADDTGEEGLFHDGTRFLSRFEVLLFNRAPLLLSSTISADNTVFAADLTNPDLRRGESLVVPRGEIHLVRTCVLGPARCAERIRVTNYALSPVSVPLSIRFDADFKDVFEVRGTRRMTRGQRLPDAIGAEYVMAYRGLDGVERRTRLQWSETADSIAAREVEFVLHLEPRRAASIELDITYETASDAMPAATFDRLAAASRTRVSELAKGSCFVFTSNDAFNRWLNRSSADIQMMLTDTPHGLYPYAGIPWFNTPFGRDGLVTAFELLWAAPHVAKGVLEFLAETQATGRSEFADMQPGKILHEMRGGEMAALGEVPFGRYYGSADATPLFIMLAHAYYERTGDRALIDRLWPNIVAAVGWMHDSGDIDGDGFIEYARQTSTGLVQQGWKDSHDSIFHADGSLAQGPIAVCEVQAYAYGAWTSASRLSSIRGDVRAATEWSDRAAHVKRHFEEAFWSERIGSYALALCGDKRMCEVRASNAGHCLFTGLVAEERAKRVCAQLMNSASFAGWGIRTVAAGEARYNPMSYHNGSIWPHDNALIAAGLSRYGYTDEASRILVAMFELSAAVDLHRLPELICGFDRRGDEHPTLYPVACAPQAWAAGAVYLLLAASLGLHIDGISQRVTFTRAHLPPALDWVQMSNLQIGAAHVDLRLERHQHDVGVTVLRRDGPVEIVSVTR